MEIVKAEVLWTRVCPLHCKYCAMATGRRNTFPLDGWLRGIAGLQRMGCGFMAFYGAEPLADFQHLPEVVGAAERSGIHTTVITSGMVPDFFGKLDALHAAGGRSLSMSYDPVGGHDAYSRAKSAVALSGLTYFQQKKNVRDVAAIITLTRKNFKALSLTVENMSGKNIWTFFDLIHADRGQAGSKCSGKFENLLFREEDIPDLIIELDTVAKMKEQGYLCHSSHIFLSKLKQDAGRLVLNYDWNCAREENFPAWVTVDCDGVVYPCDDFQPGGPLIYLDELPQLWDFFSSWWKPKVQQGCPGCCWNTHIDAHAIKAQQLPFSDYVHERSD